MRKASLLALAAAAALLYACSEEPIPRRLLFRVDVDEDETPYDWNDPLGRTRGDLLREAAEAALAEWRTCNAVEGWLTTLDDPSVIPITFAPIIQDGIGKQRLGETVFLDGVPLRIHVHEGANPNRYKAVLLHEFAHVMGREKGHPAVCPILYDNPIANDLVPQDCAFMKERLAEE